MVGLLAGANMDQSKSQLASVSQEAQLPKLTTASDLQSAYNGLSKTFKAYQCIICKSNFEQKSAYQDHIQCHKKTDQDSYRCDICGKSFTVPARLTRHYRTHTGEKPYQCEYCSKSFSVKENLSVHRRIHTKERPYGCNVCGSAFEHSGKLHRHMRIHTGERPHKCSLCDKTFIQSGQLVIHMRTHTGEKPYECTVPGCIKKFTCSKQLKVHTRTHTGEKPYKCGICGKPFGYNHVLKQHQVAHFGKKIYKCTLCQETFNAKKVMERHLKTHEGTSFIESPLSVAEMAVETVQSGNKSPALKKKPEEAKKSEDSVVESPVKEVSKTQVLPDISYNVRDQSNNCQIQNNTANAINHEVFVSRLTEDLTLQHSQTQIDIKDQILNNQHYSNDEKSDEERKQKPIVSTESQDRLTKMYSLNGNSNLTTLIGALDLLQLPEVKNSLSLPPRKRSKMILESMEIEEDMKTRSIRCNSVIKFAKAERKTCMNSM